MISEVEGVFCLNQVVLCRKKAISLDHHSQSKLIKSDGARELDQNVKSGFFSSESLTAVKLKIC